MKQNSGLGKGLSALIPQGVKQNFWTEEKKQLESQRQNVIRNSTHAHSNESIKKESFLVKDKDFSGKVMKIELAKIIPNSEQPRQYFKEEDLKELASSIEKYGLIQPISVIDKGAGKPYEILTGERRFRAVKLLGLKTIEAIIKQDKNNLNKLEVALIENLQRANLNPLEKAKAYQRLIEEFQLTQEEIAKRMGKGRSSITNSLRYLKLPEEIQQGLAKGKISEGHAKLICSLASKEEQIKAYLDIIEGKLSTKETSSLTKKIQVKGYLKTTGVVPKNFVLQKMVEEKSQKISHAIGFRTKIVPKKIGGEVIIKYQDGKDLERIESILLK